MKLEDTLVVGGVDAHADAHHAAALDQRGALLATASFPTTTPGYAQLLDWLRAFGEVELSCRRTLRGKATLCRRLRPSIGELRRPSQAAKFALRSIARRIDSLDDEIAVLDRQLERLVRAAAPRTTQLLGVSTGHAGQLLVTGGQNIERLRGEAAFASLCGASPVPASSGKTTRHRLNHGGDRQANRTLHLIAVCRLRYCPRTRAYAKRRTAEGKTKAEIMRCLKRYIAREAYNSLRADLAASPETTPRTTTTIYCGAGPIGIT